MKERIIQIMKSSAMTNIFDSSVIFENRFTGMVKMYNGLSEEFEMVPRDVFNELLADGIIRLERCICQGDNRYVYAE